MKHWKFFVGIRLLITFRRKWRINFGAGGLGSVHRNKIRHSFIFNHMLLSNSNAAHVGLFGQGKAPSMKSVIRFNERKRREKLAL